MTGIEHRGAIPCNNRSTDGSDQIAARYAARDPRLRVVSPPAFLDQVPNYNFTLRQIAPDTRYVKLVQADDTIGPRCLTEMIALAEAHPSIGVGRPAATCWRSSIG